jgi:hypothetical protein
MKRAAVNAARLASSDPLSQVSDLRNVVGSMSGIGSGANADKTLPANMRTSKPRCVSSG